MRTKKRKWRKSRKKRRSQCMIVTAERSHVVLRFSSKMEESFLIAMTERFVALDTHLVQPMIMSRVVHARSIPRESRARSDLPLMERTFLLLPAETTKTRTTEATVAPGRDYTTATLAAAMTGGVLALLLTVNHLASLRMHLLRARLTTLLMKLSLRGAPTLLSPTMSLLGVMHPLGVILPPVLLVY
jgi:hypothetical protein